MKRLWKQISLFVAVVLCVGAIFALVPTAKVEAAVSGDFEYYFNGEDLMISAYNGTAAKVVIPAKLDGQPVKGLSWEAFKNCTTLTEVTISEGITMVEERIFMHCTNLKSVTIPKSMTQISDQMFYGCTSLETIIVPEGITRVGNEAFYGCTKLKSFTIPASASMIGNKTFSYCSNLMNIHVSEGNKMNASKDGVLFTKNMKTLSEFPAGRTGEYQIPEGVERIWMYAFCDSQLSSITLPESITKIDKTAFADCSSLSYIYVPEESYDRLVSLLEGIIPADTQIRVVGDVPIFYGDVNVDGKMQATDALDILKHVVKLQEITDATALQLADVDHNEVIDASDALSTLKIVVKLQEAEAFETETEAA